MARLSLVHVAFFIIPYSAGWRTKFQRVHMSMRTYIHIDMYEEREREVQTISLAEKDIAWDCYDGFLV